LCVEQLFALNEFISRTVDPGCKSLVIGCFIDGKAGHEAQTLWLVQRWSRTGSQV